jgi:toluene monooxygenase system protein A
VTGFAMDYLTPVEHRHQSFKEFVYEWILDQFDRKCSEYGLARPYYFPTFLESLDHYHHMVYASAYTYRATVWFDMPLPGPQERAWLCEKYPSSFPLFSPVWDRVTERSQKAGPNFEWYTHGATPIGFCSLCQLVLAGGTPLENSARVVDVDGQKRVFCSEPCERIFLAEKERYMEHKDVVQRILAGEAPANLLELLRAYFGLTEAEQGKDVARGRYDFLRNGAPRKDEG